MAATTFIKNVHGVEDFCIPTPVDSASIDSLRARLSRQRETKRLDFRRRRVGEIPAVDSTVRKTRQWIGELMVELQWDDAQKTYHALRAVLHVLRDHLTLHQTADLSAQLPMLIRGMFFEGWQPERMPVKDCSLDTFLSRVQTAFPDGQGVDPQQLTRATLNVISRYVSSDQWADIQAVLPRSLRALITGDKV